MDPNPHTRPVTVVTGGPDGIGFALAKLAVARGETVLLVARDARRLEAARESLGAGAFALSLDVSTPEAPNQIDARLADLGGHCDVLVQSAGVGLAGAFVEHAPAELDRLVALNVAALTRLTRHVLPGMLARGRGTVLTIASLAGYAPGPYQAAYYASKAYGIAFMEAVAHECAGQGVTIAVATPGPVATAFHERMGGETGLYLTLLPVPTAEAVARRIDRGMRRRRRVIVPGVVPWVLRVALRVLPHGLTVPIVGWLLEPRK
jgi:short-subunit dehydrogenase